MCLNSSGRQLIRRLTFLLRWNMQTKRVRNALLSCGEDITLMIPDREKERVCKIKAARSRKALEILISVGATKSYLPLRSLSPYSFAHVIFLSPICFLSLSFSFSMYVLPFSQIFYCVTTVVWFPTACTISWGSWPHFSSEIANAGSDSIRNRKRCIFKKIDRHLNCIRNKVRVNYILYWSLYSASLINILIIFFILPTNIPLLWNHITIIFNKKFKSVKLKSFATFHLYFMIIIW